MSLRRNSTASALAQTIALGRARTASVFPVGGHGALLKGLLLRAGRPGVRHAKNLEDTGGFLSTHIAICRLSTWVLTSYLVSNAIVLPISGWLVGLLGRKRFFLTCIV